jgi:hypothetical protein
LLVRAAASAASGELSIDDDGRKASDTVLLGAARDLVLMHVVDLDFMVGARDPFDHFNGLLAGGAPGAEDFDFSLVVHNLFSFALSSMNPVPSGAHCGHAAATLAGQLFQMDAAMRRPRPQYIVAGDSR